MLGGRVPSSLREKERRVDPDLDPRMFSSFKHRKPWPLLLVEGRRAAPPGPQRASGAVTCSNEIHIPDCRVRKTRPGETFAGAPRGTSLSVTHLFAPGWFL